MIERRTVMSEEVRLDAAYAPSEDVVARELEGEVVIIPLVSDIGDIEDELYTLNETGQAIWRRLDGRKPLREVAAELAEEFEAPPGDIERDVLGLVRELVTRRMVIAKS
jgi:Coenzyme PQQ synthesis protein D (PqqD)